MAHKLDNWFGIDWLYSTYMWVWAALLALTVVEVIVPEPTILLEWGVAPESFVTWLKTSLLTTPVVVVSLILMALAKTFFVAWYYMHLIDERPSIILVACAPFVFSVFLTIGIWPQNPPQSRYKNPPYADEAKHFEGNVTETSGLRKRVYQKERQAAEEKKKQKQSGSNEGSSSSK
jgi:hypothetical protein